MAINLWVDTYCTLEEANLRLATSKRWAALSTEANKESFLKQATLTIDGCGFIWDGVVATQGQDLAFPRDFGASSDDPVFSQDAQRLRLRSAVLAQVEHLLSHRIFGKANSAAIGTGGDFTWPERHSALSPDAAAFVQPYAA